MTEQVRQGLRGDLREGRVESLRDLSTRDWEADLGSTGVFQMSDQELMSDHLDGYDSDEEFRTECLDAGFTETNLNFLVTQQPEYRAYWERKAAGLPTTPRRITLVEVWGHRLPVDNEPYMYNDGSGTYELNTGGDTEPYGYDPNVNRYTILQVVSNDFKEEA